MSQRPILGAYGDVFFVLSLATFQVSPEHVKRRRRLAVTLAYLQTPLRLLTVTPSLSCFPWFVGIDGFQSVLLNLALLLFSEVAKVLTLRVIRINQRKNSVS